MSWICAHSPIGHGGITNRMGVETARAQLEVLSAYRTQAAADKGKVVASTSGEA
jgi:hypothetical protein